RAGAGLPGTTAEGGLHELVAHSHGVVGVLAADGAVRLAVEVALVARGDERLRLALLAHLPLDEVLDLRVIHVEAHHLGGATGGAAALGGARGAIEHLEEAHQATGGAAAGELLLLAADGAAVEARARAVREH